MSDNALPKAIVIGAGMIAFAIGTTGFFGFIWTFIGVAIGGALAWRELWGGEIPFKSEKEDSGDPVADRFR